MALNLTIVYLQLVNKCFLSLVLYACGIWYKNTSGMAGKSYFARVPRTESMFFVVVQLQKKKKKISPLAAFWVVFLLGLFQHVTADGEQNLLLGPSK